jgi:hypothetical protein
LQNLTRSMLLGGFLLAGVAATAEEPFQAKAKWTLENGSSGKCAVLASVPFGKRLVIEFVSASTTPKGLSGKASRQVIVTDLTDTSTIAPHDLAQTFGDAQPHRSFVSQSLRLYAKPGEDVLFCTYRIGTADTMDVTATLSGVLVDLP